MITHDTSVTPRVLTLLIDLAIIFPLSVSGKSSVSSKCLGAHWGQVSMICVSDVVC